MDDHIERALDILLPASARRAACQREIGLAVLAIRAVLFAATKRQLDSAAKKLTAAQKVLEHLPMPLGDAEAREELACKLGQLSRLLAKFAAIGKGRGRDRAIAYRRKYTAAKRAFLLLLHWRPRQPPTLTEGGAYFELTAALYEAATDDYGSEVVTVCTRLMHEVKEEEGYQPNKPAQFLAHVRASQDFFWSEAERHRPGLRRKLRAEQLREVDLLLAARYN
jgi:hypothetical protein